MSFLYFKTLLFTICLNFFLVIASNICSDNKTNAQLIFKIRNYYYIQTSNTNSRKLFVYNQNDSSICEKQMSDLFGTTLDYLGFASETSQLNCDGIYNDSTECNFMKSLLIVSAYKSNVDLGFDYSYHTYSTKIDSTQGLSLSMVNVSKWQLPAKFTVDDKFWGQIFQGTRVIKHFMFFKNTFFVIAIGTGIEKKLFWKTVAKNGSLPEKWLEMDLYSVMDPIVKQNFAFEMNDWFYTTEAEMIANKFRIIAPQTQHPSDVCQFEFDPQFNKTSIKKFFNFNCNCETSSKLSLVYGLFLLIILKSIIVLIFVLGFILYRRCKPKDEIKSLAVRQPTVETTDDKTDDSTMRTKTFTLEKNQWTQSELSKNSPQKSAQKSTKISTENSTIKPTEKSAQKSDKKLTEKLPEKLAEKSTIKPTEKQDTKSIVKTAIISAKTKN